MGANAKKAVLFLSVSSSMMMPELTEQAMNWDLPTAGRVSGDLVGHLVGGRRKRFASEQSDQVTNRFAFRSLM